MNNNQYQPVWHYMNDNITNHSMNYTLWFQIILHVWLFNIKKNISLYALFRVCTLYVYQLWKKKKHFHAFLIKNKQHFQFSFKISTMYDYSTLYFYSFLVKSLSIFVQLLGTVQLFRTTEQMILRKLGQFCFLICPTYAYQVSWQHPIGKFLELCLGKICSWSWKENWIKARQRCIKYLWKHTFHKVF